MSGSPVPALHSIAAQFPALKAVVIGDAMLDAYCEGAARRFCPDAPAPVIDVQSRREFRGGAANTAANLASLGAQTSLLSVIGDDEPGDRLAGDVAGLGIDLCLARSPDRKTLVKQRVMAGDQVLLRLDEGTTGPIDVWAQRRLGGWLAARVRDADVVIVSDYGYGVMTPALIDLLGELLSSPHRPLVAIDARDPSRYRPLGATVVKPNMREAAAILKLPDDRGECVRALMNGAKDRLLDACGAQMAAVTLDRDGAMILQRDARPYRTAAATVHKPQVSGAGDTYLAALSLALAAGASTAEAADLASAAAAVVVAKPYTATCSAEELSLQPASGPAPCSLTEIARIAQQHRQAGRKVVLTGGCFDILHRGHVTCLRRARSMGDVLIVAVNTDASVARLKGPTRPINSLADRLCVLAALGSVDYLVPFDDATPCGVVEAVRPDVFVKGGDYVREALPETPIVERYGGRVEIVPFVESRSTTGLITRIRGGREPRTSTGDAAGTTERNGHGKPQLAFRPATVVR